MGLYSQTLGEILEIPNYTLFFPHEILNYDRLQNLIVSKFYNREIAYDTVDYFRMKLNYYLEINASRYNKMLSSEYVQTDPFMTDYIETSIKANREDNERMGEGIAESSVTNSGRVSFGITTGDETNRTRTDANDKNRGNKGTVKEGKETTASTKDKWTEGEKETRDQIIGTNEYVDQYVDRTDKTYQDTNNTNTVAHKETEDVLDRDTTDKQTARDWTEKGNRKTHNLDVNSDTPMSMLFNTPNHYYGTGTAAEYGKAGSGEYVPFMEQDIDSMESKSREINGGETPWYNYATSAGNRIGSDKYDRSGNETYTRAGTDDSTRNTVSDETGNTRYDGHGTEGVNYTRNITHDGGDTKDGTKNETSIGHESDTENSNKNENDTEYTQTNETLDSIENFGAIKRNSGTTHGRESSRSNSGRSKSRQYEKGYGSTNETKSVRKGRLNKSPSKLMLEYRETLTYSADLFMLGELERCFIQIY